MGWLSSTFDKATNWVNSNAGAIGAIGGTVLAGPLGGLLGYYAGSAYSDANTSSGGSDPTFWEQAGYSSEAGYYQGLFQKEVDANNLKYSDYDTVASSTSIGGEYNSGYTSYWSSSEGKLALETLKTEARAAQTAAEQEAQAAARSQRSKASYLTSGEGQGDSSVSAVKSYLGAG